jgi:hypothetical protein
MPFRAIEKLRGARHTGPQKSDEMRVATRCISACQQRAGDHVGRSKRLGSARELREKIEGAEVARAVEKT